MITVYGFVPFDRSGRVRWMLHELDQPFEDHWLDFREGESRGPEFLAISPLGKVPAITIGRLTVFESGAILDHLAQTFGEGSTFYPGKHDGASYRSWLALASGTVDPCCFDFVRPDLSPESKALRMEQARVDLPRILDALLRQIGDRDSVLPTGFSAIDIQIAASLHYADRRDALEAHPQLKGYLDRARERPAAVRAGLFSQ